MLQENHLGTAGQPAEQQIGASVPFSLTHNTIHCRLLLNQCALFKSLSSMLASLSVAQEWEGSQLQCYGYYPLGRPRRYLRTFARECTAFEQCVGRKSHPIAHIIARFPCLIQSGFLATHQQGHADCQRRRVGYSVWMRDWLHGQKTHRAGWRNLECPQKKIMEQKLVNPKESVQERD